MPDWETCPHSYLCAYYLGADGAYAQGAMDTLAQRYRQAPNTVQNYLNTLAAKYAGVDRQLLSQIRLAAREPLRHGERYFRRSAGGAAV